MAKAKKVADGAVTIGMGLVAGAVSVTGAVFGAPRHHTVDGLKLARNYIGEGIKEVRDGVADD